MQIIAHCYVKVGTKLSGWSRDFYVEERGPQTGIKTDQVERHPNEWMDARTAK